MTGSPIESTVQQINRRVQGIEESWLQPTSDVLVDLPADHLSDSAPLETFWLHQQASQTGSNAYNQAT